MKRSSQLTRDAEAVDAAVKKHGGGDDAGLQAWAEKERQRIVDIATFRVQCREKGIDTPERCGPSTVRVLLQLQAQPLARKDVLKTQGYTAMNTAVRHGLAQWQPDTQSYVITPRGREWLQQLETHKLLPV